MKSKHNYATYFAAATAILFWVGIVLACCGFSLS